MRALSEGTDSAGGFTVPEIVGSRFIDRVRDALVVQRAGAQIVPMTSDTLHLARLAQPGIATGSPAVNAAIGAWKAGKRLRSPKAISTLERVTFTAQDVADAHQDVRRAAAKTRSNIDQIIEDRNGRVDGARTRSRGAARHRHAAGTGGHSQSDRTSTAASARPAPTD